MLAHPHDRECRLGAQSWLTDGRLLVDDWLSGHLWSWNVSSRRISRVATSQTTGINLYVAREVMAQRFQ